MVKKNNQTGRIGVSKASNREKKFFENSEGVSISRSSKNKKKYPLENRTQGKPYIRPSHRAVFDHYKKQGFRDLSKAIRKTGHYSESAAKNSNVVKKTKSWQLLLDEQMPEEHLARRHAEVLDKRDYRKNVDSDGNIEMVDDGPSAMVLKGLDMAYKLRGSYTKDETLAPSTVMYNLFYKPEVREQMKNFEEGLKQTLMHEIGKKSKKDMEEADRVREQEAAIDADQGRIIDAEIVD